MMARRPLPVQLFFELHSGPNLSVCDGAAPALLLTHPRPVHGLRSCMFETVGSEVMRSQISRSVYRAFSQWQRVDPVPHPD